MLDRTRARTGAVAAAALAAGLVSLVPLGAAHAASAYSLLVLPDAGESQIYSFINSATSSIDMTMYELRDTTVENDLIARAKAGVKVRVILDRQETSVNGTAYSALQAGGVSVEYSSTAFTYTHQKTVTVDDKESYISTGNLDTTYYSTSRDYGVFDTNASDVSAIEQVFNADFAKTSITPSDGADLVWSPTDSQNQILALINGAQHSLDIEQEEFGDSTIVNAIVAAEKRGVAVRVVSEDESNEYDSELAEVTAAGGQVKTYTSSTGYYIHAKAIVADAGTSTAKIFLGSENFSSNSLNENRELGLIISDTSVISGVESAFDSDFGSSSTGGSSTGSCGSGNLLGNPGFESGTAPWTASSGVIYSGTTEPARTGSYDAWLDGYGKTTTDTLAQTVTLPTGCSSYTFSFYMHINTAETSTTAKNDTLKLQVLDSSGNVLSTLYTYTNLNANTGYSQHTFTTLGTYAGQTVTLKFTGAENSSLQTSFVIDDTSLTTA